MKILKYIAIGLCVLFTISSGIIKFAEWSGLDVWLASPADMTTKGGIVAGIIFIVVWAFSIGFGIAWAKFSPK